MFAALEQFFAIARSTLTECLRQPVALAVVLVAGLFVVLSNPFSAYTMSDDNHMFVDIGLSTLFLAGAILAAFLATSAISREIENKTLLTIVSKPVSRSVFVIGRFAGVAGSLIVSLSFLALLYAIVEQHGVLETAATPIHLSVVLFGAIGLIVSAASAVWMNYFHNQSFAACFLVFGVPILLVAYLLSMLFNAKLEAQTMSMAFEPEQWKAIALIVEAIVVLCAIAVAASTRLGQVMTLSITMGALILGLLSDWIFGRTVLLYESMTASTDATAPLVSAASESVTPTAYAFARTAWSVVPDFQMFFVTDAINQGVGVPAAYFWTASVYACCMVAAFVAIAIALFQRREVG
ncbi:MAG: ABC transporter permease subunit [Planctomycetota bacterium]|nr:ABC transporter permease subunit [Planctomycetota bacterium]